MYLQYWQRIMQIHNDATSHKGTEIINLITNVLTTNDRLRTICLAGDIISVEGSAECQSTAPVNQFSESGQLLEGWRKETEAMCKSDPSLPALLAEIPKKECVCVSRTLGATLSADNCSTARKCTSRMSQKMIATSKAIGITDKKKLFHHVGHCFNYQ